MNMHLTMPLWQQLLLMAFIPLVIAVVVVAWKVRSIGRQGSTRPLRKRRRHRH